MKIVLFIILISSQAFAASSPLKEMTKKQRTMWNKGLMLEYCSHGKCITNPKATNQMDFEYDLYSRIEDYKNSFKEINGRLPSLEEESDYVINHWGGGFYLTPETDIWSVSKYNLRLKNQ